MVLLGWREGKKTPPESHLTIDRSSTNSLRAGGIGRWTLEVMSQGVVRSG